MKAEVKVGLMFIAALFGVVAFVYSLGAWNPFSRAYDLQVAYNFAGGLEVGSPVRVMGIKVGKVKSIRFVPDLKMPSGEEVKLKILISVSPEAWPSVRRDSRFFINLAGVIGEKFLEISPGTLSAEPLKPGDLVRGEDPPRIDQLISQSYGLAGKIIDIIEKNESSVVGTIETMNKLVVNLDKVLKQLDRTTRDQDVAKMLKNMALISDDMAFFTSKLRSPEGQKTLALLRELVHRLDPLDAKAIKRFLQEEGIKAKLF